MTDPIFVRTRFDYYDPFGHDGFGSYHDYWRMVELSNFPTCYMDEIDPASDNVYIISPLNGEVYDAWPDARARIIHWNLEQDGYPPYPGICETWVSDARLAECTGAKYVLMGSHEGLRYPGEVEHNDRYDVIMLAYMTPRREQIAHDLIEQGLRLAPNGWGLDRHKALISSTVMLQVHQNDGKRYVAPQRFALAAAYRLPLITETLDHPGAFAHQQLMMAAPEYMAEFVRNKTRRDNPRYLQDFGHSLYRFLCHDHPFRREVERAL